jgi:hypothetical protein
MRLGRVVDFKSDVIGTSRRSGRKEPRSDSEIWRRLPEGTCWFACHLEPCDIEKIFVYGDREWKQAFGSFSLKAVAAATLDSDDKQHHKSRIQQLMQTLASGHKYRSLALTAFSGEGPYVMIDGNHRAAAMLRLGILAGQSCYVGFHQRIGKDCSWFRHAVCGSSMTGSGTSSSPSHNGWTSAPLAITSRRRHSRSSPGSIDQGAVDQGSSAGEASIEFESVEQGTPITDSPEVD